MLPYDKGENLEMGASDIEALGHENLICSAIISISPSLLGHSKTFKLEIKVRHLVNA